MVDAYDTNGILLSISPLTQGGNDCWVCCRFTPFEVTIITSRGWRRLPCCCVECYRKLPAEYEKFVAWQNEFSW